MAMRDYLWQEHFSVACFLPASFPVAAPAQVLPSLQLHCALMVQNLPSHHVWSKARKCIHKNVDKYNWGKMLQDKRLLFSDVPFENCVNSPACRLRA
jgi:hypothetical protein